MATKNVLGFYKLKGGKDKYGNWYLARARLFFVTKFPKSQKFKDTLRSYNYKIDYNRIKTTLESLDVKVDEAIIDPTEDEIIKCFEEKIDYFGCAIMFIFSHGDKDHFYCTDYNEKTKEGKINVWDRYYHYFSGEEKPELRECPKVFFNDWCKDDVSTEFILNEPNSSCQNTSHRLIYGAQPRYPAYTHQTEGSICAKHFCDFLDESQTKDLVDILTMVKQKVSEFKAIDDNDKKKYPQTMEENTLIHKLYLLHEDKVHELSSIYRKEFQHISVLGIGAFGVVLKAKNIEDEVEYAIKRILFKNETEKIQIKKEIRVLAKLSVHPNIVNFKRVFYETVDYKWQLKQDRQMGIKGALTNEGTSIELCYIQMELCRESLDNWLTNKPSRDKVESLKIFKQLIEGLSFIHKKDVVHRDLKPANILFAKTTEDSNLCVRIADFGLSKHVGSFASTKRGGGTQLYMAPEVSLAELNPKLDIYSAGLILLELLHNCSGDQSKIFYNAKLKIFPPELENTMNFAVQTLNKMLSIDVNDRPSSEELLQILTDDPDWNEELQSVAGRLRGEHPSEEEDSKLEDFSSKQDDELQPATGRLRGEHPSEVEDSKLEDFSSKEEWQFASECTSEEHSLQRVGRWKTVTTMLWDGEKEGSDWFPLKAASSTNTRLIVQFDRRFDDVFVLRVCCTSLDVQFRAAAVRVVAVVLAAPRMWGELAVVLKPDQEWSFIFSEKVTECPEVRPIKLRVTAQCTELEHLSPTHYFWIESATFIRCSWQLCGWNAVTPTAYRWNLWSEPFSWSGCIWRIRVSHCHIDEKRKLQVWVELQHTSAPIDCSSMSWKCSLKVWSEQFDEMKEDMNLNSRCSWTVVDDVEVENRDPLDIVVDIHVSKKI